MICSPLVLLLLSLIAAPIDENADFMVISVIVKLPLCVVGIPWYMNWILCDLFIVRLAERSILRSRTGSSVILSCTSSVALELAGVNTWGALPLGKYMLPYGDYDFRFMIIPF